VTYRVAAGDRTARLTQLVPTLARRGTIDDVKAETAVAFELAVREPVRA
jgi:hypothetical protein